MEDIVYKELTNQGLSASERRKLRIWLNGNPKNRLIYNQLKLALKSPTSAKSKEIQEEIWRDIENKIKYTHNRPIFRPWLKVAAVLLAFISFGIIIYSIADKNHREQVSPQVKWIDKVSLKGQKISTILPDGTRVKLNAGSKLLAPTEFIGDKREVTLTGEAYFDVAHDESKPFIINTKSIKVRVLGTSFNVKSYPEADSAVVVVASGKVAVSDNQKSEHKIKLLAGEKVAYSKNGQMIHQMKFDWEKELGWKDNILLFRGDDLLKITRTLSNWYGIEFKILNHSIDMDKQFTGRYEDPSLKVVLKGISFVYGFDYKIEKNLVVIK